MAQAFRRGKVAPTPQPPCPSRDFLTYAAVGPTAEDTEALNALLQRLHPLVRTIQAGAAGWAAEAAGVLQEAEAAAEAAMTAGAHAVQVAG